MTVQWTQHRFAGGVLALDTANTVVLRGDARGFDRFDEAAEIGRFAEAASIYRAEELGERRLCVKDPAAIRPLVIEMREAIDRLFRSLAAKGRPDPGVLPLFLRACASGLDDHDDVGGDDAFGRAGQAVAFEAALAVSALSLLSDRQAGRLRICPNCRWLFVDRSRNGSRLWCDMAVCGNRQKAKRHYRRHRGFGEEHDDA